VSESALLSLPEQDRARAMRYEIGPVGRQLAGRYFEPVRFPESAVGTLAQLSSQGTVIHVMRSTSWVNYLYLSWALVRHGLPPIRAVVNLRRWFTKPWVRTAQRGDFDVRFTYARRHAGSTLVFLKETVIGRPRGKDSNEDPFPALIELAKKSEKPVFLVPELLIWEKWNQKVAPDAFDFIFGSPEAPGFLHTLFTFLRNYQRAQFRIGEPIDLTRFVNENPDADAQVLARKVRSTLHHHLARETRAVFGPPQKHTDRLLDEAMRDRTLRKSLEEVAQSTQRSTDSVAAEARKCLDQIAARHSPSMVALLAPGLHLIFNKIYDGIDVDEAGLERAMKTAAQLPVVITPSHKSHVDYLVLSYVLWRRGYQVPLVAAGANLSFFPLGFLLRRGGAFFLRRSFKGDKIYTAAFKAYVKKLVHDGIHHEFFPEGGRSRTGKLLQPRLGLFSWQVDAVLEGARDDLAFVPVAIDYERVVESSSYSAELKGGEKKAEDLSALLNAPKVLSENYGRIHLSFDEPISLAELMRDRKLDRRAGVSEDAKKGLVRALGNSVMYGISKVSVVTPHALLSTALLAHRRRGISAREITDRVVFLRRAAADLQARFSRQLEGAPSTPTTLGPVGDALRSFKDDGFVRIAEARGEPVYQLVDERRSELAFYKNTLLNLIAGRTIVATALVSLGLPVTVAAARERALFLSRLFKLEFIYPVGMAFETIFNETVEHLSRLGLIVQQGETIGVAPEDFARPTLDFLADAMRDYLECYLLAATAASELAKEKLDKKEFIKRALELGRGEFLEGRLTMAEALSRTTLDNALLLLIDLKYVAEKDKALVPGEKNATELAQQIRACLAP
jgi:glycerol-3-phosphate O-acyltransferase